MLDIRQAVSLARTRLRRINIHSLPLDLVGDLITLFCWKLSRRSPTETYPYGFGKFEVLGTAAVSVLLTGGALGLGLHSLSLLVDSLSHTAATLPPGALQEILVNVTQVAHSVPSVGLEHAHSHGHALDPNAAWFAAIGTLAKEWLYRATKKVADEENITRNAIDVFLAITRTEDLENAEVGT